MVRPARPEVHRLLVERTASMLARRETVTLRGVVAGTGLSTMAVYTYFDGMPGLFGAVRQEGFSRLAARLGTMPTTDDPVRDLSTAAGAYAAVVMENPNIYRLMFDGSLPLPDPGSADATLDRVVDAAQRGVHAGRFHENIDPRRLANELWMIGHGACMLVVSDVLAFAQVEPVLTTGIQHLYIAAGDDPAAANASFGRGWSAGLSHAT